jgi:hypothetical protein
MLITLYIMAVKFIGFLKFLKFEYYIHFNNS